MGRGVGRRRCWGRLWGREERVRLLCGRNGRLDVVVVVVFVVVTHSTFDGRLFYVGRLLIHET